MEERQSLAVQGCDDTGEVKLYKGLMCVCVCVSCSEIVFSTNVLLVLISTVFPQIIFLNLIHYDTALSFFFRSTVLYLLVVVVITRQKSFK